MLRSNKAVAVLPWKPWRNLEPSGSSSGVYSLYPPTKSWLKTLRPTRGPGDNPVLLRWPSTWNTRSTNVNIHDGSLSVREHTFYNNLPTLQKKSVTWHSKLTYSAYVYLLGTAATIHPWNRLLWGKSPEISALAVSIVSILQLADFPTAFRQVQKNIYKSLLPWSLD